MIHCSPKYLVLSLLLIILLSIIPNSRALNNGLGRTPQMGYNSWYDVFMTPSEQMIKDTIAAMKSNGLYDAGYRYLNLDDGMVVSRDSNGVLQPDPKYFPSGFKAIADYIHSQGMMFGVYTDRGPKTCGGRPSAQGYETIDANTYAAWGVDYVKEDSCNAPQDHQTAYKQYSLMRDALNATGRKIFFSLCGWNDWYAPVGKSLGNSWRIGPDDTNWAGILKNIDINAALWSYAGPGGWNDPCLLLGNDHSGTPAVTEQQARAQFTMWAIMASPMLLSQNVRNLSSFQLQTYLNQEVIAVGQDSLGRQGQKLFGGDLSEGGSDSPLTVQTCASGTQQSWNWNSTAPLFLQNVESGLCANVDDCGSDLIAYPCVTSGGTCAGPNSYANEQFMLSSDGRLLSMLGSNMCVTSNGVGSQIGISPCVGSPNQVWMYNSNTKKLTTGSGNCVTVGGASGSRANIWGRPLDDGSWAVAFINAGNSAISLTCAADCLGATGWDSSQVITVRDLWQHVNLPTTTVSSGISVGNLAPNGGIAMFRVTPIWK